MSWNADQVYTLANQELLGELLQEPGFQKELFLVNNLEGIRSDWTKNMFSNEKDARVHGLPEDGLLVIKPTIYFTGYDDRSNREFWDMYENKPFNAQKWAFLADTNNDEILDFEDAQLNLLSYLKGLSKKHSVPFVYYNCVMWGGDLDKEDAVVIKNGKLEIFTYDYKDRKCYQIIAEDKVALKTTVLQTAMIHLGLELKSWFFALHEASFHWESYWLSK
ncbi:MAG: hypothetical protein MRY83_01225 [Flavobacteriales bacterium]|nr:hypothetical protein [Flavobacteriales bacterium]